MIYIPRHFAEPDTARLHALIRAESFGTLVSSGPAGIQVSHLPFTLDAPRKLLRCHLARGNPQWRSLADTEVVAIFQGPHHYVSPAWYGHHPSVPTWNYAVVHVQGRARMIEDPAELEAMVRELVEQNEAHSPQPWRMELPEDYRDKMIGGIVGFEIDILRMDGKFKLSQNRLADDRVRVAAALEDIGSDAAQGVAGLMRENLNRD
jgi:transcriptional regulator